LTILENTLPNSLLYDTFQNGFLNRVYAMALDVFWHILTGSASGIGVAM